MKNITSNLNSGNNSPKFNSNDPKNLPLPQDGKGTENSKLYSQYSSLQGQEREKMIESLRIIAQKDPIHTKSEGARYVLRESFNATVYR